MSAAGGDGVFDKPSPDSPATAPRKEIDVPHAPDGSITQVEVDVQTTNPDDLTGRLRHEKSLTRAREAINAGLPLVDDSLHESIPRRFALREQRGEMVSRQFGDAGNVVVCRHHRG